MTVVPLANGWRRFWPLLLTMRRASAWGFTSTPKTEPLRRTSSVSTAVTAPVTGSMLMIRSDVAPCVTPSSWPVAGRTSMPTTSSSSRRPLRATPLVAVRLSARTVTRRSSVVRPYSSAPPGAADALDDSTTVPAPARARVVSAARVFVRLLRVVTGVPPSVEPTGGLPVLS